MNRSCPIMPYTNNQGCKIYEYVKQTTHHLLLLLGLSDYYPSFFDTTKALLLKMGGYDCGIGAILFNLEARPFTSLVYSTPMLGRWFCQHRYRLKNKFEVDLDLSYAKNETGQGVYTSIFLATLNNYLNPLINIMETKVKCDERKLIILPRYSHGWLNYPKLKKISRLDIVFLEDILPRDIRDRLNTICRNLTRAFRQHSDQIVKLFQYNGRCFGRSLYPVLGCFLNDFIAPHIIITRHLYDFLKCVSQPDTEFYIARNRRAIENAFVQIANHINGNTNMILHGMIFPDLTTHLFSYNFGAVKRVYVWGQQGRDVIQWRQARLGESLPILLTGSQFASPKAFQERKGMKGNKVLFAGQSMTEPFIKKIAKDIPVEIQLFVRLHPGQKSKIKRYRVNKGNVHFDELHSPIQNHFNDTDVFISFSSTAILEAISYGIPTLIINFEELKKTVNVFRKTNLNNQEQRIIMVDSVDELIKKIGLILHNSKFRETVLKLNHKMMSYFVDLSYVLDENRYENISVVV